MWVPSVTPPTVQNQLVFQSNPVTQQVAQTSFVNEIQQTQVPVQVMRMQNETVTQQVPVQVTRMQNEVVTQQVPVQVTRMHSETVTQQVPVQTTRMVPMVETRRVPITTQRPVTETRTRRVPVEQTRWVTEERVRRVPVTNTRIEYETRTEPHEVRYFEQERVVQTVRRPVTSGKYVPYEETVMVPRQVVQRVPLSYYDPFAPAILQGFSTLEPSSSAPASSSTGSASSSTAPVSSGTGSSGVESAYGPSVYTPSGESATGDDTVSAGRQSLDDDDQLKPRVRGVESTVAPADTATSPQTAEQPGLNAPELPEPAQPAVSSDDDELKAPVLNGSGASFRIQYRPQLLREI